MLIKLSNILKHCYKNFQDIGCIHQNAKEHMGKFKWETTLYLLIQKTLLCTYQHSIFILTFTVA